MRIDWRELAKVLLLAALLLAGTAQAGTVQYVYDGLGRLVAVVDEAGSTTVYTYDPAGNILSVANSSSSQLAIATFTPASGPVGETVTVVGAGFVANPAQNTVSFAGVPATVSAATGGTLVVTVPVGATSGPITVSNANGTATSAAAFTVVVLPAISGVNPAVVGVGTTRVDVSGSNLTLTTSVTFSHPGITAQILTGGTNTLLPLNITVAAGVPANSYHFSLGSTAGSVSSGSVTLAVGLPLSGPATSLAPPMSVFLPQAQSAPSAGDGMSLSPATSVFLPQAVQSPPPSGDGMSVGQPTSVSMP